jgi:hypothetical protein
MKPMGQTSTPFLTYREIDTKATDLYEDAFGLATEFGDVIRLLGKVKAVPDKKLTKKLMIKVRGAE